MWSVSDENLNADERAYCMQKLEDGAYWYSFKPTGDAAVDLILGAVSAAGKMCHHTNAWGEDYEGSGKSPRDLIQAAANEAAALFRPLVADSARLDWLQSMGVDVTVDTFTDAPDEPPHWRVEQGFYGATVRDALDAAMKQP